MLQEWRRTNELLLCHGHCVPTKRSSGLYLLHVRPALLPFHFGPLVDSSTSRFTEAIPREGTESDRDLLGSGSPSACLKNRRRTVSAAQEFSTTLHTANRKNYWLLLISVVNKFRGLNFRS